MTYATPRSIDMLYDWSPDKMVEVLLDRPDDFLKIKETLTRIGIVSRQYKEDGTPSKPVLTQTCHLLHKRSKYYVMHFKEMFCLDERENDLTVGDVERRNLIVNLLQQWKLLTVVKPAAISLQAPMSAIRVVAHKEKDGFELRAKYTVGKK